VVAKGEGVDFGLSFEKSSGNHGLHLNGPEKPHELWPAYVYLCLCAYPSLRLVSENVVGPFRRPILTLALGVTIVLPSHPVCDNEIGARWYDEDHKVFVMRIISEGI
jgi:hypothetical protein